MPVQLTNTADPDGFLRLAYVVHSFDVGGLERCVAHLCNGLDRARFRPMVVCLSRNGGAAAWIEREDVPIVEVGKRAGNDLAAVGRLARILREHRIDLVHSHNWGTLIETSFARRSAPVPVHVHAERGTLLGDASLRGPRVWLRAKAARWAMNRADCVVTVAESLRQKLLARCGPLAKPIQVIPNGVARPRVTKSDAELRELRQSLGIPPEATVLGSVGRLVPVKDFRTAIDAVCELGRTGHNIHLVLVGDGPEHESLSAHAATRGVRERVHLVGRQHDVGNWLAMMDIYLNVSLSEGMSQSILEAMAAGLPMVVTDVGDSRALLDGQHPCGLVVSSGDPRAFAEAVRSVARSSGRTVAFRASASARHRERYAMETMIDAYESLYCRLTTSCPSKANGRQWPMPAAGGADSALHCGE